MLETIVVFHQFRGHTGLRDASIITWLTFKAFLYTMATKTVFQSLGTIHKNKELLKILVRMGCYVMMYFL